MITIYYPKELYFDKNRRQLFPLLKPFIKGDFFSDNERQSMYYISDKEVTVVKEKEQADWIILPMSWNYYSENNQLKKVIDFIKRVQQKECKVFSFTTGDFGVTIPKIENLVVFRQSGERSKLPENHIGLPSFIEDPLSRHFQRKNVFLRDCQEKPVIGFCGQTNKSFNNSIKEVSRTLFRNLKYHIGLSKELPQKVQPTSKLRAKILTLIKNSPSLTANFIERKKYRAGVITKEARIKTTQEFYNNLKDTQYTVCVRGAGNFSVRLYETLAMGRIPVFINTNCILPLVDKIDWKKHVVWIEEDELHLIEEKIMLFHNQLTPKTFIDLQHSNRKLWEEKLTLGGFFKTALN